MKLVQQALLLGTASANPLGHLLERQAPNPSYRTKPNWKTVHSTYTTYTSTSTVTAPTSTSTVNSDHDHNHEYDNCRQNYDRVGHGDDSRLSCLSDAAQTTPACQCAIPSPTTSTTVLQTTSTRLISITSRLVSTTTFTPPAVTTVVRTTTLTRQRRMVSTKMVMHTTESAVTRTLAAILTAFYIADKYEEETRHFAEWPADSDEVLYHVQYDFDLGGRLGELHYGVHVVSTQNGSGNDPVQCKIEATDNEQCALLCTSGSYNVNSPDNDGSWILGPEAAEYQFANCVIGANIELEQKRSEFRKRGMELRRAAAANFEQ
ncbi:hypothetical protein BST61_g818 [Cercospora zeina]